MPNQKCPIHVVWALPERPTVNPDGWSAEDWRKWAEYFRPEDYHGRIDDGRKWAEYLKSNERWPPGAGIMLAVAACSLIWAIFIALWMFFGYYP